MDEKICPLCSGSSFRLFCRKADSQYARCESCDIVFAQPRLTPAKVKHGAEYWARQHQASSGKVLLDFSEQHFQVVHRPRLNVLARYRKLGRLLDVGCAAGSFLKAATQDGWDAFGVEIAEASARYGIEEQGLNIFVGGLEEAKYPDGYFDAVTMWDVIEHLLDPISLLQEVHRILRPGGVLALSTPNIQGLSYLILRCEWHAVSPQSHFFLFTPSTLAATLRNTGFRARRLVTMDLDPTLLWALRGRNKPGTKASGAHQIKAAVESSRILRMLRWGANIFLSVTRIGDRIVAYALKTERLDGV